MPPGEKLESAGESPVPETPEISREAPEKNPTPQESVEPKVNAVSKIEETAPLRLQKDPAVPLGPTKDQMLQAVERVLEDGLRDPYLSMPKQQRREFRAAGEALAIRLRDLSGQKVRPNSVYRDVMAWLEQVPNANLFWLQQAGYIKTSKVIGQIGEQT